jgi:integrase
LETRVPRLTDKHITGLKCPQEKEQIDVADDACPGLKVRVFKSGAKSFALTYWSPLLSRAVRISLGRYPDISLALAREKAAEQRKKIGDDKDPRSEQRRERRAAARAEDLSFEALCDAYMEEYAKPNKSSWKNDEGYLKRPKVALGHMPAHTVTDDDIADVLDEIAEDAPISANRTQSVIHKMFEWARQPGRKYVPSNPITGMERRGGSEKARNRVLSDDEIRTLWWGLEHPDVPCDRQVALALKMVLATMVRPYQAAGALLSEISGLGTEHAQYQMPPIRVKGRREVIVPVSPLATEVIKAAIKDEKQVCLFPSKYGEKVEIKRSSLSQALNDKERSNRVGIRSFLKMEHFTPHDLRRTAATLARRCGAPRPDVKAMLDHIDGDVTAVYDKYDMLPEKRAVSILLSQELKKIIGDQP